MKQNAQHERLSRLQQLYSRIEEISAEYVSSYTDDNFGKFIDERSDILREIAREEFCLKNSGGTGDSPQEQKLRATIADTIRHITHLDSQVMQKIRSSMSQLSGEISGLYGSSRAARAYVCQSRR